MYDIKKEAIYVWNKYRRRIKEIFNENEKEINEFIKRLNILKDYCIHREEEIKDKCLGKNSKNENWKFIRDEISIVNNTPGVYIENDKTQAYLYLSDNIKNVTNVVIPEIKDEKNIINYLGFSFDGNFISIRQKTYGKYIYRMRRKIDGIERCNGITYKGNKISYDNVYEKYSKKGLTRGKKKSNFISYVRLSNKIFKEEKNISNIEKNHMRKIAKVIKQKRIKYRKKNL